MKSTIFYVERAFSTAFARRILARYFCLFPARSHGLPDNRGCSAREALTSNNKEPRHEKAQSSA